MRATGDATESKYSIVASSPVTRAIFPIPNSGVTRLEGSPDDLLKRQDFEELFLGAGPRSAAPRVEEEDNT